MPALTSSFVTFQDCRSFFIRTRRELRARGFAVAMVFYDQSDGKNGRLFSRIDKYDFDTVLWHQPDRAAKETVPQLKDSGVQVIGLSDSWFPSIRCRYEVQRESAIMSILRDWRANDAITSVVVVRGIETSAAEEERLKTLLEEEGIAYEFKSTSDQRLADFLNSFTTDKHRGIIFPSTAAALFAFRAPEATRKTDDPLASRTDRRTSKLPICASPRCHRRRGCARLAIGRRANRQRFDQSQIVQSRGDNGLRS